MLLLQRKGLINMAMCDRIRQRREELGLSQDELAQRLGYKDRSTIAKIEAGVNDLNQTKIAAFANALETTTYWLMGDNTNDILYELAKDAVLIQEFSDLSEEKKHRALAAVSQLPDNVTPMPNLRRVPRLGTIACGEPILAEQNIEGYDQVPDWVKCDFTLTCKGDSMINARIYDGDVVCIKAQPEVENGQIAAVLVEGEFESEATLKRFYFDGGIVQLVAENPRVPPMVFSGADAAKIRVLGLATHFVSKVV